MKSIETQGKTVDQAIEIGLYKLGVERDKVKITILEEAGLFNKARVRISLNTSSEAETKLKLVVEDLCRLMNLDVDVYVEEREEDFYVDVTGKDAAIFIGKRGDNLEGFATVVNAIAKESQNLDKRVIVDSDGYKQKREDTLKVLAKRTASRVINTGKSVKLEPMSAYERRIIHTTLADNDKISTASSGKEPYRYVVVSLVGGKDKRKQKHDDRVAQEQKSTTNFTNMEITELRPNND